MTTAKTAGRVVVIVVLLAVVLSTGVAHAYPTEDVFAEYFVAVKEAAAWFTGVRGDVYVMSSPNVVTRKVTSIAVSIDDD